MADKPDSTPQNKSSSNAPDKIFSIRKIYIKDVSFEAPSSPEVFVSTDINPVKDIQVLIEHTDLNQDMGLMEVALKITVTSKHEDKVLFLAEVQQAGIFQIKHPDPKSFEIAKEVTCPHTLLPFVREELNNLITKGGFSSFLLNPINFEAALAAKKEQLEKNPESETLNPQTLN